MAAITTIPWQARGLANPERSTRAISQHQVAAPILEFELAGDTITLTQISSDESGRAVAVKMTIRADGGEYPTPYGNGIVLQARWASPRTLEAAVKNGEHVLSHGTYEVSSDGRSLTFSTAGGLVAFDRS